MSGFFATNITLSDESLKTVNLKVNRNYFYFVTNLILYFVKNGTKMASVRPFKMLFNQIKLSNFSTNLSCKK